MLLFKRGFTIAVAHSRRPFSATTTFRPFDKILIANRGEIACRVIATAKRLGVKTVAVFSDADRNSKHVSMADEAVYIGGSSASESYLNSKNIIRACKATGAQAVHPGYGFLSENLAFCQMCEDEEVVFIGPPPYAIRTMGSKSVSKSIMLKAGVPITPGYHGDDQSDAKLLEESKKIGWPVMIKAVSGGGGKGMRPVHKEEDFLEALQACRREGLKSFSDENVLVEKIVQSPRHVELQIFGDTHGNVVHLLDRDCSIQRRHQKVLEEAPAPNLDAKTRQSMRDAAVACAKAVGYVGAGTVEFLVNSETLDFYFCEMNTRLQVEHPVTEMITGVDLVEWQLNVAAGAAIPLSQDEIISNAKGCAVEARIYAENPLNKFLPQTGHLFHMQTPDTAANGKEDGVRVDTGVVSGDTISPFYDPMIAKLICFADTRDEACKKLERALRNFQVAGLQNNINFLGKCVRHPGFAVSQPTTAFFEDHMTGILESLRPTLKDPSVRSHVHLGLLSVQHTSFRTASTSAYGDFVGFRNGRVARQEMSVACPNANETFAFQIDQHSQSSFSVAMADDPNSGTAHCVVKSMEVLKECDVSSTSGWSYKVAAIIDGKLVSGVVSIIRNNIGSSQQPTLVVDVWVDGQVGDTTSHLQMLLPIDDCQSYSTSRNDAASTNPVVLSPMPAKVIKLNALDGQLVKQGDQIAILEAMKMEHILYAPCDGTLKVFCSEGDSIGESDKVAEITKPVEVV